jgi:hypothetical protein
MYRKQGGCAIVWSVVYETPTTAYIFESMAFVHKEPVYAELLKRHHIVLAGVAVQLFKPRLQAFLRLFKLLDGEPFAPVAFQLV